LAEIKLEYNLSPSYPKIKIITDTIGNIITLIVLGILFYLDYSFNWPAWVFWVLLVILVITIVGFIWSFIQPKLEYNNWSYQYNHEYLQLKFGVIKKQWVTIPMTKIQAVSTTQGPVMKRFNVRSIKVQTMGSEHIIPLLEEDVALRLREIIADFARLQEVDDE